MKFRANLIDKKVIACLNSYIGEKETAKIVKLRDKDEPTKFYDVQKIFKRNLILMELLWIDSR